jgi:hypothetical protein
MVARMDCAAASAVVFEVTLLNTGTLVRTT